MQRKWQPLAGYMSIVQTDVHAGMRSILVDWLVQVSLEDTQITLPTPYICTVSHH